jgi:transposase
VDELYLGKSQKFIVVVSNLETGEPLWFGLGRKKETLDEFFEKQLKHPQRGRINLPGQLDSQSSMAAAPVV